MTRLLKTDQLLEFPCEFPIKAMGRAEEGFLERVVAIINRHVPHLCEHAVRITPSRNGNYISVTVLVMASSRSQLDDIYRDLTACESIIMAL